MASLAPPTDILELTRFLVSPYSGIVRRFQCIHKDVTEPQIPFVWRAELSNHCFLSGEASRTAVAAGKGLEEEEAMRSALGEAIERYCGLRFPTEQCLIAPRSKLEGPVLEPELLVLHSEDQIEALGYARYSPELEIAWVRGERLDDGSSAWIPAHSVYLVPPLDSPSFFQATSNGLAAGGTRESARLRAILELVERDAFLAAWYHRLPVRRIDISTHPDLRVAGIADAYARRGVGIEAYLVPADHGIPVVIGLAIGAGNDDPAVVVGLGAHGRLSDAVRSAVTEVGQVRPAIRMKLRDRAMLKKREELVEDPSRVSELEDHDLLYTHPSMTHAFDMWRSDGREPLAIGDEEAGAGDFAWTVGQLMKAGSRTYAVDVTTSDIAALGLHVARAFVEDFQPIHFGETQFRRAGKRFYDIPRRLGLADGRAGPSSLNPLPHPLS